MMSMDKVQANIEKIRVLFPNAVTEVLRDGKPALAVDFDVLKQELADTLIDDRELRYQFTWPDKQKSILLANTPISATLRPCKEESVDFDNTQNLYIEGNNLEVLKLLQETYLDKIKMIYIDPPYNTGTNLIYKNDFSILTENYLSHSNQFNDLGMKLVQNPESNGRFHTDWLNMIYPALKVSKDLLADNGYITIAIDDNEVYNLKKICDEIFGEFNYIGTIITRCNPQGRNKNNIDPVHEYHLVYAKNILSLGLLKISKEGSEYGYLMRSGTNSRKSERPYRFYPLLVRDGNVSVITENEYSRIYNPETGFDEEYIEELSVKYTALGYKFVLPFSKDGEAKVWQRQYSRVKKECATYIYENGQIKVPGEDNRTPISLWAEEKYSNVAYGTNNLKKLFESDKIPFDFSKSIFTVKDLISLGTSQDDLIIDFFPGSATTAHAVMQLNAEDGCTRKFIMVQLPEVCDEKSEAYKAGYKNICEIGKERIRRAGKKIKVENSEKAQSLDIGFRVFKLDSSNMQDVYYKPEEYSQTLLDNLQDNIKPDRTALDLLFQVMLELGKPLSAKITQKVIAGKSVFNVDDGDLIACFEDNITTEVVKEIAKEKPLYAVFRDSGLSSDSVAVNFEQIFATYSPNTKRKVL